VLVVRTREAAKGICRRCADARPMIGPKRLSTPTESLPHSSSSTDSRQCYHALPLCRHAAQRSNRRAGGTWNRNSPVDLSVAFRWLDIRCRCRGYAVKAKRLPPYVPRSNNQSV